jgi:hypothetical protein
MDEPKPLLRTKVAVAFASLAVFAFVTSLTDSDRGVAAAFAFCAIVVTAYVRWDLRRRWFYWIALALLSIFHIVLLTIYHPIIPSPTIRAAPLVFLDFVGMVAILIGLEKFTDWIRSDSHT